MKQNWVIILSSLLVALFLYTGLVKFLNFQQFNNDLQNQPFSKQLTPFLAWGLPSLEILIAVFLLFHRSRLMGLMASLLLLLIFTFYTALILLHGFNRVPCSCGGVIRQLSWGQHLVFNLFFVIISIIAIILFMHECRGSRKPGNRVGN